MRKEDADRNGAKATAAGGTKEAHAVDPVVGGEKESGPCGLPVKCVIL